MVPSLTTSAGVEQPRSTGTSSFTVPFVGSLETKSGYIDYAMTVINLMLGDAQCERRTSSTSHSSRCKFWHATLSSADILLVACPE